MTTFVKFMVSGTEFLLLCTLERTCHCLSKRSTLKVADGMMAYYQSLIIFIIGLFSLMVIKRVQQGKVLYLHGGWLPYGQYSCSRNGSKLHFQREK